MNAEFDLMPFPQNYTWKLSQVDREFAAKIEGIAKMRECSNAEAIEYAVNICFWQCDRLRREMMKEAKEVQS